MTLLLEHPLFILLTIAAVGFQWLVTQFPSLSLLGWGNAVYHAMVIVAVFLSGGSLEDVLLLLLCSMTAALAFALYLPDKQRGRKKPDPAEPTVSGEDAARTEEKEVTK